MITHDLRRNGLLLEVTSKGSAPGCWFEAELGHFPQLFEPQCSHLQNGVIQFLPDGLV